MEKEVLKVYDTFTKELVDVEVSKEFYQAYKRTEWSVENNNRTFQKHELQFCALKGDIENFNEMVSDENSANQVETRMLVDKLRDILEQLSDSDRELIKMLFFENKTERECAEYYGINQKNINKKKKRILCSLNKLLKKRKN